MSFTDEDLKEFQKHISEFSQCSELQELFPRLLTRLDAAEKALTIAIGALEYDTREHSVGFGCAGTQIRASQALARIEKLGDSPELGGKE